MENVYKTCTEFFNEMTDAELLKFHDDLMTITELNKFSEISKFLDKVWLKIYGTNRKAVGVTMNDVNQIIFPLTAVLCERLKEAHEVITSN